MTLLTYILIAIVLSIFMTLLAYVCYCAACDIKDCVIEDKLYNKATRYIDRWNRHAGIIPTPTVIVKYNPDIPKNIAERAYRDFMTEKGAY